MLGVADPFSLATEWLGWLRMRKSKQLLTVVFILLLAKLDF